MTTKKTTVKKTPVKKAAAVKAKEEKPIIDAKVEIEIPTGDFIKAIGRRKEASAQVKLFLGGTGVISVNGREYTAYFPVPALREGIMAPLKLAGREGKLDITALVRGGGLRGQAEAVRLGIARGLVKLDETLRKSLKKAELLTRDPRVKERKKYGLKKARKAPQWAKR